MTSVDDDEDGRMTLATIHDHRPARKDDHDERNDAWNSAPSSPMPVAGPVNHFTVRHLDSPQLLVEPI